ncbi:MAG: inositol monophosphatase family protein [Allosphingosinicella sp.]
MEGRRRRIPRSWRPALEEFADFACLLADAARAVAMSDMRRIATDKNEGVGGFDPVTAADTQAELEMRALIIARYPDHGIAGEELPERPARCGLGWSLDPIDGTRAYICGLPSWTILIALLEQGRPVLGLVDAPALDERYLGYEGSAKLIAGGGGQTLHASNCRHIAEARVATTDPYLFDGAEAEGFARLRAEARLTRYGYDAYAYARLAGGTIDLVVESGLKPHDHNALIPIVRGAGGVVGNWRGGNDVSGGDLVAAATPELFQQAVALLSN